MNLSPSSDNVDKKPAQKSRTTEIEVFPKRTSCTNQMPLSEPIQWVSTQPPSSSDSTLEVHNFCWSRFVLLPKPLFGRYIQFTLPLASCRLGSVTEKWWQVGSICPVIASARYEMESWTDAPTKEIRMFIQGAERVLESGVSAVSYTQQLRLISKKVRYVLASLLLLGVLVVLGLAGWLIDPTLLSVFSLGLGLLFLWCFFFATYYSAAIRKVYIQLRTDLEWYCTSHSDMVAKGYTFKIVGPLLLQITLPE